MSVFTRMCPRQQQEVQQLSDPSCIKTASTSSCTILFFTSFIAYINHSFSLQPLKLSSAQLHETMKQEQSLQSKSPAELQRFRWRFVRGFLKQSETFPPNMWHQRPLHCTLNPGLPSNQQLCLYSAPLHVFLKLKAVVIDGELRVVHQSGVQFDAELPEFRYRSYKPDSISWKASWVTLTPVRVTGRLLLWKDSSHCLILKVWPFRCICCSQDSGRSSYPHWQTHCHLTCAHVGQGETHTQ